MIQQVFKQSVLHAEPSVFGRRLLPLSLGHLFILQAYDSPYFYGAEKTLGDLVTAAFVCCHTWEENQRALTDDKIEATFERWGSQCANVSVPDEDEKMTRYIKESCIFPVRFIDPAKANRQCLHPWPLYLATSIMPLVGESRAWNMPCCLAISYASARAEWQNGDDSLRPEWIDELKESLAKESANG